MRMNLLNSLLFLLFFISCNYGNKLETHNNDMKSEIYKKQSIDNKELKIVLDTNNYKYIKQVLENYNIEINEVQNGLTILDEYQYYLRDDILNLLKDNGAKYCKELKSKKCNNLNIVNKFKLFINSNKISNNLEVKRYINKVKNIDDIIEYLVLNNKYKLLKFILKDIGNLNKIKFKDYIIERNDDGSIKVGIPIKKYRKILILDYAIKNNSLEIISLLRQHGAKRSCEILKTKCEPLSPEIEKILNGDK